jgi:hypothetical protein
MAADAQSNQKFRSILPRSAVMHNNPIPCPASLTLISIAFEDHLAPAAKGSDGQPAATVAERTESGTYGNLLPAEAKQSGLIALAAPSARLSIPSDSGSGRPGSRIHGMRIARVNAHYHGLLKARIIILVCYYRPAKTPFETTVAKRIELG